MGFFPVLLLVDDLQDFGFDASEKPDTQGRDHSLNDHHREMGHNGDLGDQKNTLHSNTEELQIRIKKEEDALTWETSLCILVFNCNKGF